MPILETLGLQAGGAAIGAGMGLLMEGHNDRRQRRQQEELQKLQIKGQKEMSDYQLQQQLKMWDATNYAAQVAQLKKAGLNPGLMYGMGGGGGATTGNASGSVQGASAPSGGGEAMQMAGMGMQLPMVMAQTELAKANTELAKTETEKKGGVDTENVKADTQNKILQGVIQEFAGKEAKDVYERVKSPNRSIEAKTYEDEMAARQGVAGTIYDLWINGKLEEKSLAEIEGMVLKNAKTREETRAVYKQIEQLEENIKGAKLENIMKELESKLQTQTGIDRNSPYWLKILGRLFVGLMGK